MTLTLLQVTHLRNIQSVCIHPSPYFNLIIGKNGSGKSSLLEAIHYLSLSRSFRSRYNRTVISFEQSSLSIFAKLEHDQQVVQKKQIGIEKFRSGESKVRINGEDQASAASLASLLPVLLINADNYLLLNGAAAIRRQFIDWGVFHVEHRFIDVWKNYFRILKQRNAALRIQANDQQVQLWTEALIPIAIQFDDMRRKYIKLFMPIFNKLSAALLNLPIEIKYNSGWEGDLLSALNNNYCRDVQLGYTQKGPHRADLRILSNKQAVKDSFSRGQQKLLFFALKLSQGILLHQVIAKSSTYLIDDLAAELDGNNRALVAKVLKDINAQVFITGVDESTIAEFLTFEQSKMFHVEHGAIVVNK